MRVAEKSLQGTDDTHSATARLTIWETHLAPDWRVLAAAPSLPATADHWRLLVGLLPWLAELTGVTGTSRLLR